MDGGKRDRAGFWPLALLALLVPLAFSISSATLGRRSAQEGLALARQSVVRAAVQCYALEGFYPPSLDYLTGRYGVAVDRELYFIDYRFVASNLMPDITVLSMAQSG